MMLVHPVNDRHERPIRLGVLGESPHGTKSRDPRGKSRSTLCVAFFQLSHIRWQPVIKSN